MDRPSFVEEARARLIARSVRDANGCLIFDGSTSGTGRGGGYGRLRIRGQYWAAHRLSFLIFKGRLVPGKHIGHCCPNVNPPNRRCIEPEHLDQMSPKRNQKQRVRQMRQRGAFACTSPEARA